MNRVWARRLGVLTMLLLAGCVKAPSLPEGYLLPQSKPRGIPISNRVLLVADNQLHNVYGEPVKFLRTGLADRLVPSAIRPIQLDFYGQDFLDWVVRNHGALSPIVHLGDACDLSCTGEFARFWEIMRGAGRGWVMAPGNHDGYFFGNTAVNGDWPDACRNAGAPMTKDIFVRAYLAALVSQEGAGHQALARHLGLRVDPLKPGDLDRIAAQVPSQGDWRYQGEGGGARALLHAVSWRIDTERPWRSFVVQEVDMTLDRAVLPEPEKGLDVAVRAILLDTSQYDQGPTLIPSPPATANAGITGELLSDQISVVQSWLQSPRDADRLWVLMGHHPFDSLGDAAREAVDGLRKLSGALLYVSAHTHAGQFIVHGQDEEAENWLELNVGSILDWSLEVRALQFYRVGERYMVRSPRYTMHEWLRELEGVPANDQAWEAKPHEADYYLSHGDLKDLDAHKTEIRLKNSLLAAHDRLLRVNPTSAGASSDAAFWPQCCGNDGAVLQEIARAMQDPRLDRKIAFLLELDRFERERPVDDPGKRRKFRLSQAIWASKYDSVHARKPLPDNWFVIFPRKE